tara:strand:+ start:400 stop:774 length:375 start_codon:yes stop_codon:yes gene_type:complete
MEDFNDLIRKQSEYKSTREDKYKTESKDRLGKILKKKVQTTMIGALSSIEEHFSFLWNTQETPEQKIMYDLFQKVRSEILDKGNTQARNIDSELSQYEVRWQRYNVQIPVVKQEEQKELGESDD